MAYSDREGNLISADSAEISSEFHQERIPEEKVLFMDAQHSSFCSLD